MKKIMSLAILFVLILPMQTYAYAITCVNCSNMLTQMLMKVESLQQLQTMLKSYQETVEQTTQQIEMVRQNIEQFQNMVKNTIQLPNHLISKFAGELSKLAAVTNQLNTLRNDVAALSKIHDGLYMSQDVFTDLANAPASALSGSTDTLSKYRNNWFERVDESTKATFQLSGQQLKDIEDSGQLQSHINELLSTPDGQVKAIMASNQLASLQIYEARQLRELMSTRVQSDLASQMKKNKEEQYAEELKNQMFDTEGLDLEPIKDPF